jgi:hypothetical protein
MSEPTEAKRLFLEQLTDRFINDPEFREQMRLDPEGTAEVFGHSYGVQLSEDVRQGLHNIDWSLPDEQLNERASKAMCCHWT